MSISAPSKMTIVQAEDGASMYIDLEAPHHMARMTLWKTSEHTGACDLEILDADTGDNIFWQHQDFQSRDELNVSLAEFMREWNRLILPEQNGTDNQQSGVLFRLSLDGYSVSPDEIVKELLAGSPQAA